MGFLENLKRAHRMATDEVEGDRLWEGVSSSLKTINPVYRPALEQYVQLLRATAAQVSNFSREGRIKVGRAMQEEARSKFDFDVAGAHALWLAGAWLEAGERSSPAAQRAFEALNRLAQKAVQVYGGSLDGTGIENCQEVVTSEYFTSIGEFKKSYPNFESWYVVFKKTAGVINPQLAPKKGDGGTLLDFMDHTPLKAAYSQGVSPRQLAQEFASQFDTSTWMKDAGLSIGPD